MENKIILEDTIEKINNLSNEKNKITFITNFNEIKNSINKIDKILVEKSEIDENTPIDKLFDMLEKYKDYVENDNCDYSESNSMDIKSLKKIKDITELIEQKLNEKMIVFEVK